LASDRRAVLIEIAIEIAIEIEIEPSGNRVNTATARDCGADREVGSPARPGSSPAPGGQVVRCQVFATRASHRPGAQSALRRATPPERRRERNFRLEC